MAKNTKLDKCFVTEGRLSRRPSDVELIVVSSSGTFRRLAKDLTNHDDNVLEIGASTGKATRALASTGARVLAVDKSEEQVRKTRCDLAKYSNVTVVCLDGRNIPALAELMPDPSVILIDIGGNARLDNVALQLRMCLRAFRPRLVLVRSSELAEMASLIREIETPKISALSTQDGRTHGRGHLDNLLNLSHSSNADCQVFAAKQLDKSNAPAARKRLQELLSDEHQRVRRAAEQALGFSSVENDGGCDGHTDSG